MTWAGLAGEDPITGTAAGDDDAYDWQPIADRDFVAPYGMLVSQTCDVGATGTGGKHPFVEIASVFRRNDCDQGERRDIEQFKSTYQVALTQPPEDGFWVADLRLVMPISKALLAAYDPLPGFASSKDLLNLAEALARKRRRPALHEALSEDLPKSLDAYVKEKAKAKPPLPPGWLEKVEQVRLRVTGGDRLRPTEAQLWVVQSTPLDAEETEVWRGWHARRATPQGKVDHAAQNPVRKPRQHDCAYLLRERPGQRQGPRASAHLVVAAGQTSPRVPQPQAGSSRPSSMRSRGGGAARRPPAGHRPPSLRNRGW